MAATLLAVFAGAWLAFWPGFYQVETQAPGEGDVTLGTASLIAVEGWGILPLLVFPLFLTFLAYLGAHNLEARGGRPARVMVYGAAMILGAFCLLGLASIGLFYLPSALALAIAAFRFPRRDRAAP